MRASISEGCRDDATGVAHRGPAVPSRCLLQFFYDTTMFRPTTAWPRCGKPRRIFSGARLAA
jgi:hypothetical protein